MKRFKQWFSGLSTGAQWAVICVAVLLGLGTVNTFAAPDNAAPSAPGTVESAAYSKAEPVITTDTVMETEPVAFGKKTVETSSLAKGVTQVTIVGANGVKTKTYTVTKTDGVETKRVLVKEEVTTAPVDEITSTGTYVAPAPVSRSSSSCDSNYAGACVPIASDVDCGGGSGNGPEYVWGTVTVIGADIYGLDRDGDGYGCE